MRLISYLIISRNDRLIEYSDIFFLDTMPSVLVLSLRCMTLKPKVNYNYRLIARNFLNFIYLFSVYIYMFESNKIKFFKIKMGSKKKKRKEA